MFRWLKYRVGIISGGYNSLDQVLNFEEHPHGIFLGLSQKEEYSHGIFLGLNPKEENSHGIFWGLSPKEEYSVLTWDIFRTQPKGRGIRTDTAASSSTRGFKRAPPLCQASSWASHGAILRAASCEWAVLEISAFSRALRLGPASFLRSKNCVLQHERTPLLPDCFFNKLKNPWKSSKLVQPA